MPGSKFVSGVVHASIRFFALPLRKRENVDLINASGNHVTQSLAETDFRFQHEPLYEIAKTKIVLLCFSDQIVKTFN